MWRHYRLLLFVGLSVTLWTKSTKFDRRYLADGLSEGPEGDDVWHFVSTALAIHQCGDWRTSARGGPLGREKCFLYFCNAFLVHLLAKRDEIWHDEGHWCVSDTKAYACNYNAVINLNGFWWTLVYFSARRGTDFRQRISRKIFVGSRRNSATLYKDLASAHIFPEFCELLSGVPQYRAATYIGPIHWWTCFLPGYNSSSDISSSSSRVIVAGCRHPAHNNESCWVLGWSRDDCSQQSELGLCGSRFESIIFYSFFESHREKRYKKINTFLAPHGIGVGLYGNRIVSYSI